MPCKRDRYDIKRIETVANRALLILGVLRHIFVELETVLFDENEDKNGDYKNR